MAGFAAPATPGRSSEEAPREAAAIWKLAYGRTPDRSELELAMRFLDEQVALMKSQPGARPRGVVDQALTNFAQMLLISNEFLYTD